MVEKENVRSFRIPEETGVLFQLKKNPKDPQEIINFKLIKKVQVSHNTFVFTFEFPDKNLPLGIQIGQHIAIE